MFELSIIGNIASAHFIDGHKGTCKNLHGHTWKIEVTVMSKQLNKLGMVSDFAVLKKQLREILDPIDHVCLNELPYFKKKIPTTENIAEYIYEQFRDKIGPLDIKDVRVWESDTSSVTYRK